MIIECPESEKDLVSMILKEEMESACELVAPLTADVNVGKTWYETH